MPANYLHWQEIDQGTTQPINPSDFSVIVGKPVTIEGYTGANTLVYNHTLTPTSYNTFLQTYVNVSEIEIMNENMNETLHIQATSNGTTQAVADVLPFQTTTIYVPGMNYTVSLNYYNFTTGQPIGNTQTITTFGQTGLQWWIAKGLLLSQIQNTINFTRRNVSNEINDLKVTINLDNSQVKNLTLGVDLNLSGTNVSIQNFLTRILVNETFLNSTILNVNNSLQARFEITNSIIHEFQSNITVLDTYTNDTVNLIKNITNSFTLNLSLVNATVGEIKTISTQNFTALNSTIKNNFLTVISNQNFFNSTIKAENNNVTLFWKYENSLINSTTGHINIVQSIINSTAHEVSTNLTFDYSTLNSLIGTNSLNINQSIVFSKNLILKNQLIYSTALALDDYVQSGGTGVITKSDGTTTSAYMNVLDPYQYDNAQSYANLTTTKNTTWFGNPVNPNYSNVLVSGSPAIYWSYDNGSRTYTGLINVTYYNTTIGLTYVKSQNLKISSSSGTIHLSSLYLEDGYIVKVRFVNETGITISYTSQVDWAGQIVFTWQYDSTSHIYDYKPTVPDGNSQFGAVNLANIQGSYLNTTSIAQEISVAFPASLAVNVASVTVKDITTDQTLNAGSQYFASSAGVAFQYNYIASRQYYITFNTNTNTTTVLNQNLQLTNPKSVTAQSSPLGMPSEYGTVTYTNTHNAREIYNFYISIPTSATILSVEIVIDGQVVNGSQVSWVGNTIAVSNVGVSSGSMVTIGIYYATQTTPASNYLFANIVPGLTVPVTVWDLVGMALVGIAFLLVKQREVYASLHGKRMPAKKEVLFRGYLGLVAVGMVVWFVVWSMHSQGLI